MSLTRYRPKTKNTRWERYDVCGCGALAGEACFDRKAARYRFASQASQRHLAPRKTSIPHPARPRLPEWQGRRAIPYVEKGEDKS